MQPEFLQSQYRHLSNPRLRGVLLHGIFWIVWLARNVYDGLNIWGWTWASLYTLTIFLSQAPLVYLHLYWLVPSYLNKKKILGYVTLTTVLVLLSSWCNYHLLQFIPKTDMPVLMSNFLERITWNYNVLEGIIILILTYAL
jgi:hypothetical protein